MWNCLLENSVEALSCNSCGLVYYNPVSGGSAPAPGERTERAVPGRQIRHRCPFFRWGPRRRCYKQTTATAAKQQCRKCVNSLGLPRVSWSEINFAPNGQNNKETVPQWVFASLRYKKSKPGNQGPVIWRFMSRDTVFCWKSNVPV